MARELTRGQIWMYRFAHPDKRRPVLILSRPRALQHLHTATVAPITSSIRGLETEVRVGPEQGLKHESVVNLDHIVTVPKSELGHYVGQLDPHLMRRVCEALNAALACRWA